jgi:hypothetical protein
MSCKNDFGHFNLHNKTNKRTTRNLLSHIIPYRLDSNAVAVITGVIYRRAFVGFVV